MERKNVMELGDQLITLITFNMTSGIYLFKALIIVALISMIYFCTPHRIFTERLCLTS